MGKTKRNLSGCNLLGRQFVLKSPYFDLVSPAEVLKYPVYWHLCGVLGTPYPHTWGGDSPLNRLRRGVNDLCRANARR